MAHGLEILREIKSHILIFFLVQRLGVSMVGGGWQETVGAAARTVRAAARLGRGKFAGGTELAGE